MLVNQQEPDKTKTCWVLMCHGAHFRRLDIRLREYEWRAKAWRPTETPEEYPTSLYRALEKADWVGKLPVTGRARRPTMNIDTMEKLVPFFQQDKPLRHIERQTGVSRETIRKMRAVWLRDTVKHHNVANLGRLTS